MAALLLAILIVAGCGAGRAGRRPPEDPRYPTVTVASFEFPRHPGDQRPGPARGRPGLQPAENIVPAIRDPVLAAYGAPLASVLNGVSHSLTVRS